VLQGNVLPAPTVSPSELWLGNHRPPKERGLRKLAVSLALAASLAFFALAWWLWPHGETPGRVPGPLAVLRKEHDQRLARARTPQERVQVLADIARKLTREAGKLADKSDED